MYERPTIQPDVKSNYAYFPIIVDEREFGATRNDVFESLEKEVDRICRCVIAVSERN